MKPSLEAAVLRAKARLDTLDWYPEPVRIERVRVFVAPWFFRLPGFRRYVGYAFWRTILLKRRDLPDDLITHELCHIWQWQHRWPHMAFTYLTMRYRDNPRALLDPSYRAAQLRESAATETPDSIGEVRRLVAKSLGVSDDTILEASSLRDLGVNSLDLVVLVMAIEERFRIEFDPTDLERLRTFGELARRVEELNGGR